MVFHGFTRCNRVLHGVSRCYKVLQGVIRVRDKSNLKIGHENYPKTVRFF